MNWCFCFKYVDLFTFIVLHLNLFMQVRKFLEFNFRYWFPRTACWIYHVCLIEIFLKRMLNLSNPFMNISILHFTILWNEKISVNISSESYFNVNLIINVASEHAFSFYSTTLVVYSHNVGMSALAVCMRCLFSKRDICRMKIAIVKKK